ncbi:MULTISPECIES: nucleotidyltransferase family protein [unclassified Clostridium]|uniref:tRNA(Met) cytidine acetate ligase n=1 Tax=unclassified Clostridium TaxID=2614128 RepID=UPI002356272C|nr:MULTISPECIES: nucleotidyltransferase family protein [unclassified Clostridium]MBS5463302.1 nucleotidyltransferase family protein [Clostridium sp.]
MKIVGLITEYNPFHAGHLYHMQQARELTGADYCVVLMSGSFVQRGEPAIFDKYLRTKTALLAGADLVLEIPAAFSTASAHEFAAYGVALLSAIGVDAVVFGSECGQIEILKQAAYALNHESAEFQERLRKGLKAGLTYPQARAKALGETQAGGTRVENVEDFHANTDVSNSHIWSSILNSPNNILGIEYLRAAEDLHSPMEFYTISREGSGYHEDTLADANFPSASAIRGIIRNSLSKDKDLLDILASHLPAVTHPAYTGAVPVFVDDFSGLLNATVLQMQATFSIADLSPELAARLTKPPYFPLSFEERIQALKTRQLTYTRVSRALLHLVLGMREEDISRWKDEGYALYARILGFRRQSSPLLSCLHKKSSIPLITKMADAAQSLAPSALALLEQEVYASHLYQTVRIKRGGVFQNEYTEGLVFV